jgi:hypothetical protein
MAKLRKEPQQGSVVADIGADARIDVDVVTIQTALGYGNGR